jgi:hypothetical protein
MVLAKYNKKKKKSSSPTSQSPPIIKNDYIPSEGGTISEKVILCQQCGNDLGRHVGNHYHTTSFPVKYICCKCAGHTLEGVV